MTSLYKIAGNDLVRVRRSTLTNEAILQGWIAKNPSIIGLDALVTPDSRSQGACRPGWRKR